MKIKMVCTLVILKRRIIERSKQINVENDKENEADE